MKTNQNFENLEDSYLFVTIEQKVKEYVSKNSDKKPLRLGIGDVTLPLAPVVIRAMQGAVAEMGKPETFRGYRDGRGYDFLQETIASYYNKKGVGLELDEIFVSDGAKSDLGNILDILSPDNTVLIPDPVYPAYVDVNVMAGRKIVYMDGNKENGFLPQPDKSVHADIIYLCSPNNPTGAVFSKEQLAAWVEYARENEAIILFDAAYEAFVIEENLPTSIYEISGAKECALEFCSLSKTAGFTGTRCGYTIVPQATGLNALWLRRQTTKFNGVPYIIQRGAEAVFSAQGMSEVKASIAYYRQNARIMADTLKELGIWFTGGVNAPYVWLECPNKNTSWEYFDFLLEKTGIVSTPGSGFGKNGEGFMRLSAFGKRDDTKEAMRRFRAMA
ncbi:MAG: LL-diaminopimelate aminotransferase [Lachnospiraceae bacterium]|jgi:LL-diaminopimelate aminotransferase|nr:LL-diaminopimelate aminotransferase [Lachnospiraceae bacterium]